MEEIAGGEEVWRAGGVEGADCEGYCAGKWVFCEIEEGAGEEVGGDAGVKEEEFTTLRLRSGQAEDTESTEEERRAADI